MAKRYQIYPQQLRNLLLFLHLNLSFVLRTAVAQWTEHPYDEGKVVGSIPTSGTHHKWPHGSSRGATFICRESRFKRENPAIADGVFHCALDRAHTIDYGGERIAVKQKVPQISLRDFFAVALDRASLT